MPRPTIKAKARITSKGQVTIPKEIRESMGLRPGDEIEFIPTEAGVQVKRTLEPNVFEQWMGFLSNPEGRTSDEWVAEMRGE